MSAPRDTVHARNPNWDGPLCQYKVGVGQCAAARNLPHLRYRVKKQVGDSQGVTCKHCLRKLGVLPKIDTNFCPHGTFNSRYVKGLLEI